MSALTHPDAPSLPEVKEFFASLNIIAPSIAAEFLTFYSRYLFISSRYCHPASATWPNIAREYINTRLPSLHLSQLPPLPPAELPINDTAFATLIDSLANPAFQPDAVPPVTNQRRHPACAPEATDQTNCCQEITPGCQCESKDSRPGSLTETTSQSHVISLAGNTPPDEGVWSQ